MVTVGVDPHKKTHTAVVVDASGSKLGRALTVPNTPEAVGKLVTWVSRHDVGDGGEVRFAIEDGRGTARPLANALAAAGYPVVWVPVRLMVAARKLLGGRGKSDAIDAHAVAHAALSRENAKYLSTHSVDEIGRDLRYRVDRRHDLVAERTRLINNLRWKLAEFDPALEPGSLITLKAPRLLMVTLAQRPAGVLRNLLADMCTDLASLTVKINKLGTEISAAVAEQFPTLLARYGVGPLTAAAIVGELGDPSRVRSGAALARMAGTAPIPVSTSNQDNHRLDRGGNRKINTAIHTIARTQARTFPAAQKLIAKHDEKGAKHAIRVLKRHLTDALWHDIQTDLGHLTSANATT